MTFVATPQNEGPGPHLEYQAYLNKEELRIQHCPACNRFVFPPRTLCPVCGRIEMTWRVISGQGTVYSTTAVRQRPERGGDYNVALIDLAEGPRMLSSVRGIGATEVRIDMKVNAIIDTLETGERIVRFVPEATNAGR